MSSCFWATVPLRANKGGQQMQPSLSHLNPTIHLWTNTESTHCILWWIFSFSVFITFAFHVETLQRFSLHFLSSELRQHLTAAHFYCSALLGSFSCLPLTLVLEYSPTPAPLWHTLGLGDHHRSPNIQVDFISLGLKPWIIEQSCI